MSWKLFIFTIYVLVLYYISHRIYYKTTGWIVILNMVYNLEAFDNKMIYEYEIKYNVFDVRLC